MSRVGTTRAFPAEPSSLSAVRRWLQIEVQDDLGGDDLEDLRLAVTEACANAIRHSGSARFIVSVDRSERCIEVTVQDEGIFNDGWSDTDDDSHRGLALIDAVVDEVWMQRGTTTSRGTVLRMRKCPA